MPTNPVWRGSVQTGCESKLARASAMLINCQAGLADIPSWSGRIVPSSLVSHGVLLSTVTTFSDREVLFFHPACQNGPHFKISSVRKYKEWNATESKTTQGCPSAPPGSLLEMQIQGLIADLLDQNLWVWNSSGTWVLKKSLM